jgi:hypothetical protein
MWFHLFLGNHDEIGKQTLYDMTQWLVAGLTELNHKTSIGSTIVPNALNIIWDNFREDDERLFLEHNFKFGLIATEIPTGTTFNWLEEPPWPERRRAFDKIAPRAQFIWSMVEEPLEVYRQHAPSGYLELGFSERLVDPIFSEPPQTDFGFYGLVTPYRESVLNELRKHFNVATPSSFLMGSELNNFIASFKVGVCFKQSPEWPIPSPTRLGRLLHARRGIAAEYTPVATRQGSLVPVAKPTQDFAEFCFECIRGPWKQQADQAFERYRSSMPMWQIMEGLLDTTLSKSKRGKKKTAVSDDGHRISLRFSVPEQPQLIASDGGYNIVRQGQHFYALPQTLGEVDLTGGPAEVIKRYGDKVLVAPEDDVNGRSAADVSTQRAYVEYQTRFLSIEARFQDQAKRLKAVEAALNERDERVTSICATLAERDQRLRALEGALEERTFRLQGLEETLAERDQRLRALEASLEERTIRITSLERTLGERTTQEFRK